MNDPAPRAVLDHVLRLVAGAECGESLVLRGSMAMLARVGDGARPPRDLDWIVLASRATPIDDLDPYPYVNQLDVARNWPEAAHGAGRPKMWTFEDLDTGGLKPRLPPEGLHWLTVEETAEDLNRPHDDVIDLIRAQPRVDGGVILDVQNASYDARWAYAYNQDEGGGGGVRVLVPWRAGDGRDGTLQLDFAYDEVLPETPALTAVPREGGGQPTVLWAATTALSLMWKLQWLATDQVDHGYVEGKDLYDAVLLAELDSTVLSSRLQHALRSRLPDPEVLNPDTVRGWAVDWSSLNVHSGRQGWLDRLATALDVLLED